MNKEEVYKKFTGINCKNDKLLEIFNANKLKQVIYFIKYMNSYNDKDWINIEKKIVLAIQQLERIICRIINIVKMN